MYCSTKGYYLSLFSSNLQVQFFYFKTSHVIVYPNCPQGKAAFTIFQNISCYCLSKRTDRGIKDKNISKHLMLLFIFGISAIAPVASTFQNISCYCLSAFPVVRALMLFYFKTSHVIVYHPQLTMYPFAILFQNISCYCLSGNWLTRCKILFHFKTSHVIVYRWMVCISREFMKISKHLMLLFIPDNMISVIDVNLFQNISCYCLSSCSIAGRKGTNISKHLMLLFICHRWTICYTNSYFKTSHVIVYHCFTRAFHTRKNAFQNISCYCLST